MASPLTPEKEASVFDVPVIASGSQIRLPEVQTDESLAKQHSRGAPNHVTPEPAFGGTQNPDQKPNHTARPARPTLAPRTTSHARFPDEQDQLEQHMPTAPRVTSPVPSDIADEEKQVGEDETVDQPPASVLGRMQKYFSKLGHNIRSSQNSLGPPPEVIADTGIDLSAFQRLQERRASSIVTSGLAMGGLALSPRHARSRSAVTLFGGSSSAPGTGTVTPSTPGTSTPWRRMQEGFDPEKLAGRLKALKGRKKGQRSPSLEPHTNPIEHKRFDVALDIHYRRSLCLDMARAFMMFGAPAHRLEEYVYRVMNKSNVQGSVNYTVGCLEVCFISPPTTGDPSIKQYFTTMVKTTEMLNVGELERVFQIFKSFVHGSKTVREAGENVKEVLRDYTLRDYPSLFKVFFYGLSAATASVWAFRGSWFDMYPSFFLGCLIGYLQVYIVAKSSMYANVFETAAAVVASFGGRAFASIGGGGTQKYFCFVSIASGSIAPILPGYLVLCGALEMQAKTMTAGTTRLFYAVLYSLFLGYGFNIGAQLLGLAIPSAPTSVVCPRPVDKTFHVLLVPLFLASQSILLGSRLVQLPRQIFIGSAAYAVQFFVAKYSTSQVAVTASTFTLGALGHLYSRVFEGFAFTAVVAGIMTLVPSGLSAQGGLIAGMSTPLFNNGTIRAQDVYNQTLYQSFGVAAQMIQVAIGATVGLFLSVVFVYALGKKESTTLLSF